MLTLTPDQIVERYPQLQPFKWAFEVNYDVSRATKDGAERFVNDGGRVIWPGE